MKTVVIFLLVSALFYSCNNESSSTKVKLDSISEKIDTTLDKAWDSTKVKAKELKEKIEARLEKRDSAKRDTSATGNN
jgi:ElaB/YqjD/DUF883 family membrane-anchored ribosome-binding protein